MKGHFKIIILTEKNNLRYLYLTKSYERYVFSMHILCKYDNWKSNVVFHSKYLEKNIETFQNACKTVENHSLAIETLQILFPEFKISTGWVKYSFIKQTLYL